MANTALYALKLPTVYISRVLTIHTQTTVAKEKERKLHTGAYSPCLEMSQDNPIPFH